MEQKLLYPAFAESCNTANKANDGFCEDNGWSIVQAGLLAETGEIDDAFLELAQDVPSKVFLSDGACVCGHSFNQHIVVHRH